MLRKFLKILLNEKNSNDCRNHLTSSPFYYHLDIFKILFKLFSFLNIYIYIYINGMLELHSDICLAYKSIIFIDCGVYTLQAS